MGVMIKMKIVVCNKELGIIHTVDNMADLLRFMKTVAYFESKNHTNTYYSLYLLIEKDTIDEDEQDIESLLNDINLTLKSLNLKLPMKFGLDDQISFDEMKKELKTVYEKRKQDY